MKIETEDLTQKLSETQEKFLVSSIAEKYDKFDEQRSSQLSDIKLIRDAIFNTDVPRINGWDNRIELPDIYELAQTLKSHISQNMYSHPESMFDVSGTTPQTQSFANKQKAMLVNTFEQMNIENEIEKVIDGIVETGETTLFVGWETKIKSVRRAKTFEEQLKYPDKKSFILDDKVIYDNAKIKYIKPEDFVFDKYNSENWDKCAKIYRTFSTIDELFSDKANNFLDERKLEVLKGVVAGKKYRNNDDSAVDGKKVEILEFWGDIELVDGTLLKNWLVVVAARREIIRFESNPFIINPFIHAHIKEREFNPVKL